VVLNGVAREQFVYFWCQAEQVEHRFLLFKDAKNWFRAGKCDLVNVIRELHPGFSIDLNYLVNHSQGWLGLTGHEVSSDSKDIDLVVSQCLECLLVDVVASDDAQLTEIDPNLWTGFLEKSSASFRKICEVSWVKSYPHSVVAKLPF